MIYAQAGSGRRANLFTDFTFAVRDGEALVPFTKAYSGLTDAEFDAAPRMYTNINSVSPLKHDFPMIDGALRLRWRHDKPMAEANTLDDLNEMLRLYG